MRYPSARRARPGGRGAPIGQLLACLVAGALIVFLLQGRALEGLLYGKEADASKGTQAVLAPGGSGPAAAARATSAPALPPGGVAPESTRGQAAVPRSRAADVPAAAAPARAETPAQRSSPRTLAGFTVDRGSSLVRHDPELERLILSAAVDQDATFGIAIKELSSGRGLLVNPETEFYAASLFKLPIMYEVFHQRFQGKLGLDEVLQITPRVAEFDLGTLDRGEGDRYSVGQALERMITISDNSSAILLQDRVGAWRANQSMQALGMTHTFVLNERLTTAPRDMLLLFEGLARGKLIDPSASAGMVHLLLRQRVNDRLPALLPSDTPVAHKTGNWDGNVHDAGIIYAPTATVVMAVLTENAQHPAAVARTMAEMARLVYDYFAGESTQPVPVPPDPKLSFPRFAPFTPTPVGTPPERSQTPGTSATPSPPAVRAPQPTSARLAAPTPTRPSSRAP